MNIYVHETEKTFHLQNDEISYVMTVLPGGQMGQLYFGSRIHDRENFGYLMEGCFRSHSAYITDDSRGISLEHIKQEYPAYGSSDFRECALEILQSDGSRLTEFVYESYQITSGKPVLEGLPATYTEDDGEAMTLEIVLKDAHAELQLTLLYTIFAQGGVIARSSRITNLGNSAVSITKALSFCLDLPDAEYDMLQLSGSWARERHPVTRRLQQGISAIESLRGHSSHQQNPFLVLKRPQADEFSGEVMGFSLVYSGNFLAQVQVDTYDTTRIMMGIHPNWFTWKLENGETFQTPEVVTVYSNEGLNGMSQTFHTLYRSRLARGVWRDQTRPILINNWEATYFDFNEEKILSIARKAQECGVELFVLDDGWFGGRRSDHAGLGDWIACIDLLPEGIQGLSEKIEKMGMKFGLWFEPEMVNPDSDLYRLHPDWTLGVPGRRQSLSRNQLVLDFSRKEVVDYIYDMMAEILSTSKISYIKWDMNRSITECYSRALPTDRQGEVFHRYILGMYDLYERLIQAFPHILFESCAGGGARFDAGMLYYAPQAWTSDDTDAVERIKIQYGTSYAYPISSMGSHVSAVPNHQVNRITPLKTRADVAYFGTFGYELDLGRLTEEEQQEVKACTQFMKDHRQLLQFGTFYRLRSPFDYNESAWMVVSPDRREALVGYYVTLAKPNAGFTRLLLKGLDPDARYEVNGAECYYGDELMHAGLLTSNASSGKTGTGIADNRDFSSRLFMLTAKD